MRSLLGSSSFKVVLTPISSIVVMILNIAAMSAAIGQGQTGSIAGYAAGSSALAIVAVVAGGGASVGFATGDMLTRSSIRRVRYTLIAPLLAVGSVAFGYVLSCTSTLAFDAVLWGGLSLMFFNLAQLDANLLQSVLRTWVPLVSSLGSRLAGLFLVLAGVDFASAMFAVALLNYVVLAVGARGVADESVEVRLRTAVRSTYRGSYFILTLFDALISRAPFLVAPFLFFESGHADAFVALVSAAHAAQALLTSGLFTIMTVEARSGAVPWAARTRRLVELVAIAASLVGMIMTPMVLRILGVAVGGCWWILLMASIPFGVANRSRQYTFMSDRRYLEANRLLGCILLASVIASISSIALASPEMLAASHVISEGLVAVGLFVTIRLGRSNSVR